MPEEERQELKPVRWMASAKDDLSAMPQDVKDETGFALEAIQRGKFPKNTEPLHGNLSKAREILCDYDGETYRTAYTTDIGKFVYVLDTFHKKSKYRGETPKRDIERIVQRLKNAREHYEENP